MNMHRTDVTQPARRISRPERSPAKRRGSIIVFAVGFLAVMAVLAASYITVVRIDRRSAEAYESRANLRQQIKTVRDHIRGLLAADLFGNKVVTFETPRDADNSPVWPAAFEDGEYFDYPSVDKADRGGAFTFNENLPTDDEPTPDPSSNSLLRAGGPSFGFERARPDDAWLASSQPVNTGNASDEGNEWDTWPAITNLLSAYRWSEREEAWIRDTGVYVDLGQFLLQAVEPSATSGESSLRGNPEARLWAGEDGEDFFRDPTAAGNLLGDINGPALAVNQRVYDLQKNMIQEELYPPPDLDPLPDGEAWPLEPADERFWADTDGDGRPDARWQELSALGSLFGMRWVVAARIVDNSAKVNVNAQLNFGREGKPDTIGLGTTPADVDLWRLLRESLSHPDVSPSNNIALDDLERALAQHFGADQTGTDGVPDTGLRIGAVLKQLVDLRNETMGAAEPFELTPLIPGWQDPPNIGSEPPSYGTGTLLSTPPREIKRWEREAMWRFFGAAPRAPDPRGSRGVAYPLGDEVDLRAFQGFNYDRLLSKVEEAFDGPPQDDPGFIPGVGGDSYPEKPSLGPLRSKEPTSRDRGPRTFEVLAPSPDGFPANNMNAGDDYTQEDKIARNRTDIRRLLTTVSGSGSVGPIPVLNKSPEFDGRFATEKVRPNEIVARSGGALSSSGSVDPSEVLRQAFDAFVWALAPLAVDQPLAPPLEPTDVPQEDSQFHYGGGSSSPVDALESLFGEAMGATYPIWRAGALSVNLIDAIDDEMASGATAEKPTVARFFPDVSPNLTGFSGNPPAALTMLDSRFPHGDIDVTTGFGGVLLPPRFAGEAQNGVTFVGLDRQPFFKSVFSAAVYSNVPQDGSVDAAPKGVISPGVADEQLGALIAVELGNPWPEPLDLSEYRIVVPLGSGLDLEFTPDPAASIAPADSVVLVYSWPTAESNLAWDDVFDRWEASVMSPVLAMTLDNTPTAPVFFDVGPDTTGLPVQLFDHGALQDGSGNPIPVLVDRISPPGNEPFPRIPSLPIMLEDHLPPNPGGQTAVGRAVFTQTVSRALGQGTAGGFPRYVIEWSDRNVNESIELSPNTDPAESIQAWWAASGPIATSGDPIGELVSNFADWHLLAQETFTPSNWPSVEPAFQFFVPNGPLLHNSELHMLSAFAHMYVHDNNDETFPDPTPILNMASYGAPANTSSRWLTVSEQLGMAAHYFYNGQSGGPPNPYLGVLDPSRFILNSSEMGNLNTIPDTLAVPLATRIFDAFEVMPGEARANRSGGDDVPANGRININTAPREVLQLLPFVDPEFDIQGWTSSFGAERLDDVEVYRSRNTSLSGAASTYQPGNDDVRVPEALTGGAGGLAGLRQPGAGFDWAPGFATTGELAVLDEWTGDGAIGSSFPSFLELGQDGASDGLPLESRADIPNGEAFYADLSFNPPDDPEERLAIFRAISNIVSTRSDVFTAWFIVRGYRATDIEGIAFDEDLASDEERVVELMNPGTPLSDNPGDGDEQQTSPGLLPAFEERWMAIFDRSNVRSPTDRPRVLLMVQLPTE